MYPSYPVKEFFQFIADIFVNGLFLPLDWLRYWQDQTWYGANLINWGFLLIFFVLFGYWLYKLKIFHDHDKHHTHEAHR